MTSWRNKVGGKHRGLERASAVSHSSFLGIAEATGTSRPIGSELHSKLESQVEGFALQQTE